MESDRQAELLYAWLFFSRIESIDRHPLLHRQVDTWIGPIQAMNQVWPNGGSWRTESHGNTTFITVKRRSLRIFTSLAITQVDAL